jgi:hypothetical protein
MRIEICMTAGIGFVLSHSCAEKLAHEWGTVRYYPSQRRTGRR